MINDDARQALAQVLDALDTYDPLIFTDQHRLLFERAKEALAPPVTETNDQR